MTTEVDVTNRALQIVGTQTTIASLSENSNEAKQALLIIDALRDELLRMAPWDCASNYANLNYITSVAGTPENTSGGTILWQKGVPAPPWAYEYQYPVDCLRALFVLPQMQTGFNGGIPITTAVTGGAPACWQGPPQKYKVSIDQFYPVTGANVVQGGGGYSVGDIITLPLGPTSSPPIGAPVQLQVLTALAGVVLTVAVVNQVINSASPLGGSYFAVQQGQYPQASVAGVGGNPSAGTGAIFSLSFGPQASQRVILTNQEFATLSYIKQITDPNIMDPLFIDAWVAILGGRLTFQLSGDKGLANSNIALANSLIIEARKADGNEGLTVNDVLPDWIRTRGVAFSTNYWDGGMQGFDWGNTFALYA